MLIKKNCVDSLVRIISNKKCKPNIDFLLCDETYSFTYDVKTTKPGQFPDLRIFYINNFQVCINIVIEMQVQSWNFMSKGANKITCR